VAAFDILSPRGTQDSAVKGFDSVDNSLDPRVPLGPLSTSQEIGSPSNSQGRFQDSLHPMLRRVRNLSAAEDLPKPVGPYSDTYKNPSDVFFLLVSRWAEAFNTLAGANGGQGIRARAWPNSCAACCTAFTVLQSVKTKSEEESLCGRAFP
jgi:hypothetical protein